MAGWPLQWARRIPHRALANSFSSSQSNPWKGSWHLLSAWLLFSFVSMITFAESRVWSRAARLCAVNSVSRSLQKWQVTRSWWCWTIESFCLKADLIPVQGHLSLQPAQQPSPFHCGFSPNVHLFSCCGCPEGNSSCWHTPEQTYLKSPALQWMGRAAYPSTYHFSTR